ncbi:alpha-N-arabinofuranosidase [Aestuariimicrobium kwangyangense]|uniref:arabinosylfuranosidase ArfA n=1 Tax=Aestuariimicrobium kwangyangense TaxID=396389 RepID=UPI0003B42737|nr:alpha-N-arabinofuranosidase [Aestuariimicrobium kwangyangense]
MSSHHRIVPEFAVGPLNRRIFGTFVEHMGRCVYTGIHEPDHPTADEHGFRGDVEALVRELGATLVRYPGGNFVSAYQWEDGVGPVEDRPRRLDFAWRSIETNQVGTNEFLAWCGRVGMEPLLAVNLGTRGLTEAMDYLQYVNSPAGTTLADKRVEHGVEQPWGVRLWCLGNEMDGPWQIGHKTPQEYGRLAQEVGNAFKRYDESLELVACGSSSHAMPTFGEWERVVLEACFDHVDHISAHAYYEPIDGDRVSFLACSEDMSRHIDDVVATADAVAAARGSSKRFTVSFDEWNVWFQERWQGENSVEITEKPPLIEDVYSAMDAVVVGSLLITLMRHTDRVGIACQAQLVNIIAPILTEAGGRAWKQAIFEPFALTSRHARGTVLRLAGTSPLIDTPRFGQVEQVWATATHDPQTGDVAVFCCNRSVDRSIEWTLDLSSFAGTALVDHVTVEAADDPDRYNTADDPDRVVPVPGTSSLADGVLTTQLAPMSWHCLRLTSNPS